MKADTTFSLKDQLFNKPKVTYLADLIKHAYPDFHSQTFIDQNMAAFPQLELKARITHLTQTLHQHLPAEYPKALDIILNALPPQLDPDKTDDDFGDFILAPFAEYVAIYGCQPQYLDQSLNALLEITQRFTCEGAIRYFLNAFPDQTMQFLKECSTNPNYHVRRLASEGTRPKLPWCQSITLDYHRPLPILHTLHSDPTRYVTRSVANHLNDISKLDPELVIQTLKQWHQQSIQTTSELNFITKHALRTLLKQGNSAALALLGYQPNPDISINAFKLSTPTVTIGSSLVFKLDLTSNQSQNIYLDYLMQFPSPTKKPSQKVFQLKQAHTDKSQSMHITKSHPIKLMTTRRLYPGQHTVIIRANGNPIHQFEFDLQA